MPQVTQFSTGRRWFCDPSQHARARARFWFVILGPGDNYNGKPSPLYKQCRLDIHPDDLANQVPGYKSHGTTSTYSHKHLKKYAVLEPLIAAPAGV